MAWRTVLICFISITFSGVYSEINKQLEENTCNYDITDNFYIHQASEQICHRYTKEELAYYANIGKHILMENNLDSKQLNFLSQFKIAVSDILKPGYDDVYLAWWLKAQHFELPYAERTFRKFMKTVHNVEAEDILNSNYEIPKEIKERVRWHFWGFDKDENFVMSIALKDLELKGLLRSFTYSEIIRYTIYVLESYINIVRERVEKRGELNMIVLILDFGGVEFTQFLDYTAISRAQTMIQILQERFPSGCVRNYYFINIHYVLFTLLGVFQPLFREESWDRLNVFSTDRWQEELLPKLNLEFVPKHYGGNLDDQSQDPNVIYAEISRIPRTSYIKNDIYLNLTDPGFTTIIVRQGYMFNQKINVQTPGTIIKWTFQTTQYDIIFGVLIQTSRYLKRKSALEELVKLDNVESHIIPERGELICIRTGEYMLRFDNSQSWFTKKYLLLKVDIEEP